MEYVDSWCFNRGQEITLRRGPKMWHASVYLFNSEGFPFKYIQGKDKEKVLLRALNLIKKDVAKDGQDVLLLDEYHDHDTNVTPFPIEVRTESEEMREFIQSPEMQGVIQDIRRNIHLGELEKQWRQGED